MNSIGILSRDFSKNSYGGFSRNSFRGRSRKASTGAFRSFRDCKGFLSIIHLRILEFLQKHFQSISKNIFRDSASHSFQNFPRTASRDCLPQGMLLKFLKSVLYKFLQKSFQEFMTSFFKGFFRGVVLESSQDFLQ